MAVRVRAANPGPSALWIVNPNRRKGRNSMKTRRRRGRRKAARRNPVALLNPTRRRTRRRAQVHHRRRRNPMLLNPTRRRTRRYSRRRRNPGLFSFLRRRTRRRNPGGLLARGFSLATAAAGIQFVLMWVPPLGGPSAFADAGRTAAVGWLGGLIMRKTGFLARFADDTQLAGFTLAGGKLLTAFVLPWITRISSSIGTQQVAMSPADQASKQMSGIGLYHEGMVPFRRYMPSGSGMNGIGLHHEGMVPFNQYAPLPVA